MSTPGEPTTLDLDACAREPIQIPGAIQPHGVLLVVSEPDLVCTQAERQHGSPIKAHRPRNYSISLSGKAWG